jgi:hypothetical protein
LSQQRSVEREGKSQRKGHRDHELSQGHIGQDVSHQIQSTLVHPPAETTWAHGSGLARERYNMVLVAGLAEQVGKASPQDATRHVPVQLVGHEAGQRVTAGLVGPALLEGQQVLLHHLVKDSVFRLPARIDRSLDLLGRAGLRALRPGRVR